MFTLYERRASIPCGGHHSLIAPAPLGAVLHVAAVMAAAMIGSSSSRCSAVIGHRSQGQSIQSGQWSMPAFSAAGVPEQRPCRAAAAAANKAMDALEQRGELE